MQPIIFSIMVISPKKLPPLYLTTYNRSSYLFIYLFAYIYICPVPAVVRKAPPSLKSTSNTGRRAWEWPWATWPGQLGTFFSRCQKLFRNFLVSAWQFGISGTFFSRFPWEVRTDVYPSFNHDRSLALSRIVGQAKNFFFRQR